MMKKIFALLAVLVFSVSACAFAEEPVRVMALKGPTAMGLVGMMDDPAYSFDLAGAVDEVAPSLVKGEVDFAAIPANLAANLYQKTRGAICVVAVNTLGVLYIAENGDSIHSVEDLRGRVIYASGRGATPEYALDYILTGNGMDLEKDVKIVWLSEQTECLVSLLQNPDSVALLPQPFLTSAQMKQDTVREALDLNQEWAKLQENSEEKSALLTGVMVASTDFLEQHPQEAEAFLEEYAASVEYVNTHPEEAAGLLETYGILQKDAAMKAIPKCGIVCIRGEEMKEKLSGYLKVLWSEDPDSIGGKLPEDDFYAER